MDKTVTIIPATRTPAAIDINDLPSLISRRAAIREPEYAPVPGRGIATNKNRPKWTH